MSSPKGSIEPLEYWRLSDELSVIQAALLIVGEDPSQLEDSIESIAPEKRPVGYDAVLNSLTNDIFLNHRLPADVGYTDEGETQVCYHSTRITVSNLKAWLQFKNMVPAFFFPAARSEAAYLSDLHPNYSPRLAAAIEAWEAVTANPEWRRGKSVKQALAAWLRTHALKFGLTKEDGSPNEQGIEGVSKIANWDSKGGAPKTPGEA